MKAIEVEGYQDEKVEEKNKVVEKRKRIFLVCIKED